MRIGLISDIHANLYALKAVLADIKKRKVDEIWDAGDCLGYSPFPNQVIELLKKEKILSILGNYDVKVLNFKSNLKKGLVTPDIDKLFSFRWADKILSKKNRKYLKSLPICRLFVIDGKKILMVHGDRKELPEAADIVVCGHSHRAGVKKDGKTYVINPGSVGRQFDKNPKASYSILEIINGKIKVSNYRLGYDLKSNLAKMKALKFPARIIKSIQLGVEPEFLS